MTKSLYIIYKYYFAVYFLFAVLYWLRYLLNRMSLWRNKKLTSLNRLKSLPPASLRKIIFSRLKHFLETYIYIYTYTYVYIYIYLLLYICIFF